MGDTSQLTFEPACAIFYSITSTQPGLQGIDVGAELIKQATRSLQNTFPLLRHFCTLSPVPGFRKWYETNHPSQKPDKEELESAIRKYLLEPEHGRAKDPVANFHLRNGALLWRINPGGNLSERGQRESYGYMVNYYYDLPNLAANAQKYKQGIILQAIDFNNKL